MTYNTGEGPVASAPENNAGETVGTLGTAYSTRHGNNGNNKPAFPCAVCGSVNWWRQDGEWLCGRCYLDAQGEVMFRLDSFEIVAKGDTYTSWNLPFFRESLRLPDEFLADLSEQRELSASMLEAVYIDTKQTKSIIATKPEAAFQTCLPGGGFS